MKPATNAMAELASAQPATYSLVRLLSLAWLGGGDPDLLGCAPPLSIIPLVYTPAQSGHSPPLSMIPLQSGHQVGSTMPTFYPG